MPIFQSVLEDSKREIGGRIVFVDQVRKKKKAKKKK
jgi:hypothetical protein